MAPPATDFNKQRGLLQWLDHPEFRWTWRDIAACWLGMQGFRAFDVLNKTIRFATLGRWWPLVGPMEGKAWRFYLWLAQYAWPYGEWKEGRLP